MPENLDSVLKDYLPGSKASGFGSSSSPANFYGQSKYSQRVPFSQIHDTPDIRAANQKGWDVIGNMLGQSVVSTFGQTLQGIGTILQVPEMAMTKLFNGEYEYDGALANLGADIMNWSQSEMPIYQDSKNTAWSAERWAAMFPSVFSTLSLMLPGMGVAKAVGWAGNLGRWSQFLTKSTGTLLGGIAMRHGENWMEAKQVHDQELQKWLNKGFTMEDAKEAASAAAHKTYSTNWGNLAFDVLQLGSVMGAFKGLKWQKMLGNESRLGQVMDDGYAAARARGAFKDVAGWKRGGLYASGVTRPFFAQFTEGIEEAWNHHSTKEGEREAKLTLGQELSEEEKGDYWERASHNIMSNEGLEAGAWGILGGMTFQGVGSAIQNHSEMRERIKANFGKLDPATIKNASDIQEISNRAALIKKQQTIMNSDTATPAQKERARANLVFDMFASAQKAGTVEMLIEDLKRPSYVKTLKDAFGLTESQASQSAAELSMELEKIQTKIDEYSGATLNAYMKSFKGDPNSRIGDMDIMDKAYLDGEGVSEADPFNDSRYRTLVLGTTNPQTVRAFKKDGKEKTRFGFVEPAVALHLALNDYMSDVDTKIALKMTKEQLEFLNKKEITDPRLSDSERQDAKSAFRLMYELEALKRLRAKIQEEAADMVEAYSEEAVIKGKTDPFFDGKLQAEMDAIDSKIASTENSIKEIEARHDIKMAQERLMAEQQKNLDQLRGPLTPEELEKRAEELPAKQKQAFDDVMAYRDAIKKEVENELNHPAFTNITEVFRSQINSIGRAKENNMILNDPDGFVDAMMERSKKLSKLQALRKRKAEEQARKEAELNKAIADLTDSNNPEFAKKVKAYVDGNLDKDTETLRSEAAEAKKATENPKYKVATIEEFNSKFDKDGWQNLHAVIEGVKQILHERNEDLKTDEEDAAVTEAPAEEGTHTRNVQEMKGVLNLMEMFDLQYKFFVAGFPGQKTSILEDEQALVDNGSDHEKRLAKFKVDRIIHVRDSKAAVYPAPPEIVIEKDKKGDEIWTEEDYQKELSKTLESVPYFLNEGRGTPMMPQAYLKHPEGRGSEVKDNIEAFIASFPTWKEAVEKYWIRERDITFAELYNSLQEDIAKIKDAISKEQKFAATEKKAQAKHTILKTENEPDPASNVELTDEGVARGETRDKNGKSKVFIPDRYVTNEEDFLIELSVSGTPVLVSETGYLEREDDGRLKVDHSFDPLPFIINEGKDINPAFLKPGSRVTIKKEADTSSKAPNGAQVLNAYVKDGNRLIKIGYITPVYVQVQNLKNAIANPRPDANDQKNRIEGIEKYLKVSEAIYNMYSNVKAGETFELEIATGFKNEPAAGNSGGITFGFINGVRDGVNGLNSSPKFIPMSLAFGNNWDSRTGRVYIAEYYNGDYYVAAPNGEKVNIESAYGDIILNEATKVKTPINPEKSFNGQSYALIPTNNVDAFGKRIYFPVRLQTKMASEIKVTKNDGKTISAFEEIYETLLNPEHNLKLWNQMVTSVGLKPGENAHTNSDLLNAFYTEENIISLLNKLIFVKSFAKKGPNANQKIQFNVRVIDHPGKGKQLVVQAKGLNIISNLLKVENGEYKMAEAVHFVPEDQKITNDEAVAKFFTTGEIVKTTGSNDLKRTIIEVANQKPVRVDRNLVDSKEPYFGFTVTGGALEMREFKKGYNQYLDQEQILKSSVSALEYKSNVKGKSIKSHSFFHDQRILLRPIGQTKGQKVTPAASKIAATASVDPAQQSLNPIDIDILNKSKNIINNGDTYTVGNKKNVERVSHFLFGKKGLDESVSEAGNIVDGIAKMIFEGKTPAYAGELTKAISPEGFKTLVSSLNTVKESYDRRGFVFIGASVKVAIPGLAGEIDLLFRNPQGKYVVVDIKTSNNAFDKEEYRSHIWPSGLTTRQQHMLQMAAYASILHANYPGSIDEHSSEIIHVVLDYDKKKKLWISSASALPTITQLDESIYIEEKNRAAIEEKKRSKENYEDPYMSRLEKLLILIDTVFLEKKKSVPANKVDNVPIGASDLITLKNKLLKKQEDEIETVKKWRERVLAAKDKNELQKIVKEIADKDPYDINSTDLSVVSALTTEGGFELGKQLLVKDLETIEKFFIKNLIDSIYKKYRPELAALEGSKPTDIKAKKADIEERRNEAKRNIVFVLGGDNPLAKDKLGNAGSYIAFANENNKNKFPELWNLQGATRQEVADKIDAFYNAQLAALEASSSANNTVDLESFKHDEIMTNLAGALPEDAFLGNRPLTPTEKEIEDRIKKDVEERYANLKKSSRSELLALKKEIDEELKINLGLEIFQADVNDPLFEKGDWFTRGGEFRGKTKSEVINQIKLRHELEINPINALLSATASSDPISSEKPKRERKRIVEDPDNPTPKPPKRRRGDSDIPNSGPMPTSAKGFTGSLSDLEALKRHLQIQQSKVAVSVPLDYTIDPDVTRSLQNSLTDIATNAIVRILSTDYFLGKFDSSKFENLLDRVQAYIAKEYNGLIDYLEEQEEQFSEYKTEEGDNVDKASVYKWEQEIQAIKDQIDRYDYVLSKLDQVNWIDEGEPKTFSGYFRLALGDATAMGLIQVNTSVYKDIEISGAEGDALSYTAHFKDNWYAKINPKMTTRQEAKVFLATIPVYKPVYKNGSLVYERVVDPITGLDKRYEPNDLLHELAQHMEDVSPEDLRDMFEYYSYTNPKIKAVVNAIKYITSFFEDHDIHIESSKEQQDKMYRQIFGAISNQRRNLITVIIKRLKDGRIQVNAIDTARQGLTKSIIEIHNENFKKVMEDFFDFQVSEDPQKLGVQKVKATLKTDKPKVWDKKEAENFSKVNRISFRTPPREYKNDAEVKWDAFNHLQNEITRLQNLRNANVGLNEIATIDLEVSDGKVLLFGKRMEAVEVAALIGGVKLPEWIRVPEYISRLMGDSTFDRMWNLINDISLNTGKTVSDVVETTEFDGNDAVKRFFEEKKKKSQDDYIDEVYKLIAIQLDRMGLQLHENPEMSWTVLKDLNKEENGVKKYKKIDKTASKFKDYLHAQFKVLFFDVLNKPNMEGLTNDSGEIIIDEPLHSVLQGSSKLARTLRPYFTSKTNDSVTTINGNTEYTYNYNNGVSLFFKKIQSVNGTTSSFLESLSQADTLKYDPIIQKMKSLGTDEVIQLHYFDGLKTANYEIITPETMDDLGMIISSYSLYGQQDGPDRTNRGMGYYQVTHSDSTTMPIIRFQKLNIQGRFQERIDKDGNLQYSYVPDLYTENGIASIMRRKFYGEMERIVFSFNAWRSISQIADPQLRRQYAASHFREGLHYSVDKDGIPNGVGAGVNLYMFGDQIFSGNASGMYMDASKQQIKSQYLNADGSLNLDAASELFDELFPVYVNQAIEVEYDRLEPYLEGLFPDESYDGQSRVKSRFFDSNYLNALRKWLREFDVVTVSGETVKGKDLDVLIESEPTIEKIKQQNPGISTENALLLIEEFRRVKEGLQKGKLVDGKRGNSFRSAFIQYMIADYVMNGMVFQHTYQYMQGDPANFAKDKKGYLENYHLDNYLKRAKTGVSPRSTLSTDANTNSLILTVKDFSPFKFQVNVNLSNRSEYFKKAYNAMRSAVLSRKDGAKYFEDDNKAPYIWEEAVTIYEAHSDKEKAVDAIISIFNYNSMDGGSMITIQEGLSRFVAKGILTPSQASFAYEILKRKDVTAAELNKALPNGIGVQVLKYVFGGVAPNTFGDDYTGQHAAVDNFYTKHAEQWLIPSMVKGTKLEAFVDRLMEIENQLRPITDTSFPGGIAVHPTTAEKVLDGQAYDIFDNSGKVILPEINQIRSRPTTFNGEQVENPFKDETDTNQSKQANVLKYLDVPAHYHFGVDAFTYYTESPGSYESDEYNTVHDSTLDPFESAAMPGVRGVSTEQLRRAEVMIMQERIKSAFNGVMIRMGIDWNAKGKTKMVKELDKFLQILNEFASQTRGIDNNALSFLAKAGETLDFPIDFTPNSKSFQAVILSIIEDSSTRFRLPGMSLAMIPSSGYSKEQVIGDNDLKGYVLKEYISPAFATKEAIEKTYDKSEIVNVFQDGNSWKATLKGFEYAEVGVPWNFRDSSGKLLEYEKYVNDDQTPKLEMFESIKGQYPDALKVVLNRIPNTGPNATVVGKITKFFKTGNYVAMNPSLVAIIGADFDYDKLYTYISHTEVLENGKLKKVQGFIHHTQVIPGTDTGASDHLNTSSARMNYIKKKLNNNNQMYRDFNSKRNSILKKPQKKWTEKDISDMKLINETLSDMEQKAYKNQKWNRVSMYELQTNEMLENAIIDIFHIIYGNFKSLSNLTSPLTVDPLRDMITKTAVGLGTTYEKVNTSSKMKSITSMTTFTQSRVENSDAGALVGVMANAQIQLAQAQQFRFYQKKEDDLDGLVMLFSDNDGKPKIENIVYDGNRSSAPVEDIASFRIYNPYTTLYKDNNGEYSIEEPASESFDARYRLDRIYTITNDGRRYRVSDMIRGILQSALDNQKDPLLFKALINKESSDAIVAMVAQGYIDEIIPTLSNKAVAEFRRMISKSYELLGEKDYESEAIAKLITKYGLLAGLSQGEIDNLFAGPEKEGGGNKKPTPLMVLNEIIAHLPNHPERVSEKIINEAKRAELENRETAYHAAVHLMTFRNYVIAKRVGHDMFTIQYSTRAYAKGLEPTMTEVKSQDEQYDLLFDFNKGKKKISSSASSIGNVYTMDKEFAKQIDAAQKAVPNFYSQAHAYSVRPVNLIFSKNDTLFFSMSDFMEPIYKEIWKAKNNYIVERYKGRNQPGKEKYAIFVNFVSFMFSNPMLYRNMFTGPNAEQEFAAFEENARGMLSKPSSVSNYDEAYEIFKSPESLAATLDKFKGRSDISGEYEIVQALKAFIYKSSGGPAEVTYNNTNNFRNNIDSRIARSIVALYKSSDPELRSFAKRLILHAFMIGGINSPNSFINFMPADVLRDFKMGERLRHELTKLSNISKKKEGNSLRNSFIAQYFQHHPNELPQLPTSVASSILSVSSYESLDDEVKELVGVNPKDLSDNPNTIFFKVRDLDSADPATGKLGKLTSGKAVVFDFNEKKVRTAMSYRMGFRIEYDDGTSSIFMPYDSRFGVYIEVDRLGKTQKNQREYTFSIARGADGIVYGDSLYSKNVANKAKLFKTLDRVKGPEFESEAEKHKLELLDGPLRNYIFEALDNPHLFNNTLIGFPLVYTERYKDLHPDDYDKNFLISLYPYLRRVFQSVKLTLVDAEQDFLMQYDRETNEFYLNTEAMKERLLKSENPEEEFISFIYHEAIHAKVNAAIWEVLHKTRSKVDPTIVPRERYKDVKDAIESTEKLIQAIRDMFEKDPRYRQNAKLLKLYDMYLNGDSEFAGVRGEEWVRGFTGGEGDTDLEKRFSKVAEFFAYLSDSKFRNLLNSISLEQKGGKKGSVLLRLWDALISIIDSIFGTKGSEKTYQELTDFFEEGLMASVDKGTALHAALWNLKRMNETPGIVTYESESVPETPATSAVGFRFDSPEAQLDKFNGLESIDRKYEGMPARRKREWIKELQERYPALNVGLQRVSTNVIAPVATIKKNLKPVEQEFTMDDINRLIEEGQIRKICKS